MPLLSKVGTFNTGLGTSNIPVTGVGFQPLAVLFLGAKQAATGQSAYVHACLGFATSATNRGFGLLRSETGQSTTDATCRMHNAACYGTHLNSSGTIDGLLDFVSMDSDGFTVIPDDAFAADLEVTYLALGGTSLTNAFVLTPTFTSGTGEKLFEGTGFQPDCVIAVMSHATSFGTNGTTGDLSIGWATSASSRGCVTTLAENASAGSDTRSILRTDRILQLVSNTTDAITTDIDFVSFEPDGLTVDVVSGGGTQVALFLCLKGVSAKVGSVAANTSTGTGTPITGVGFKPTALILGSTNATTVTQTAVNTGMELALGWASAPAERASIWIIEEDAQGTTDNQSRYDSGALWMDYQGTGGGFAIEGEAELSSFDNDGFTLNTVDAFPAANLAIYLALGPAAAGEALDAHDDFLLYPRWGDEQMVAVY